ncbi:MAG: T9SS type A sorting domain-containing protein [Candidatus Celaenobacter antarcticus]|nr:T9SS type A sorting domain-containing protein [Candidatus Celaenobacter antarcticus]
MKKSAILTILFCAIFTIALYAEWSSDPSINTVVCNLPGEDAIPKVVAGPTGDIYFGYFSSAEGNYNVRLQRYDSAGNPQWAANGILISNHTAMSWLTDWDMTVDQDNYAILTFQDIRNAGNNNIYAYRISPEGTFMWGLDGLELSNSPDFDAAPKVTVTSAGNAVIAWSSEAVSRLQKISPGGTLLWGATGITISGPNTYSWPQPFAVENDNVIVKYYDDSGPAWAPTRHVYAQKYNANGNAVWAQPCAISTAGAITAWTQILPIVPDENYGFFIGWYDDRDSNMNADIYVQHVDSSGTCLFTTNGVIASTNYGNEHYYPKLAYLEGTQLLYVYWNEMDGDQNYRGIYGQKFDMAGTRKWEDAGKMIISLALTDIYPFGAGHTDTDVIVFYTEGLNDDYVKAVALDSDGDFIWTGDVVTMCSISSSKVHPEACALTGSQWIVAWEDERSGRDIYAQNINTDGTLGYIPVAVEPQYSEDAFLLTAIPNPFSTTTTISFNLTTESTENTEIKIYNVKGQLVREFKIQNLKLKINEAVWDGKDEKGKEVKSGVYFCTFQNVEKHAVKKLALLR